MKKNFARGTQRKGNVHEYPNHRPYSKENKGVFTDICVN